MATDVVKQIRKATRRKFTAEEKIRVVLEGSGEKPPFRKSVAGIAFQVPFTINGQGLSRCRQEWINRDTQRDATSDEVRRLKDENASLKTAVAETILENQRLKKVWPVVRQRYQRMTAGTKLEVLRAVEGAGLPIKQVLSQLAIARSTYYRWRRLSASEDSQVYTTVRQYAAAHGTRSCPRNGTRFSKSLCVPRLVAAPG